MPPKKQLPTHPPPEVVEWAKRHFATDTTREVLTFGGDPWLACQRAIVAVWKAARLYADGEALPPVPTPFELRRCTTCWIDLRMVPTEASGGSELMPLERTPSIDGTVTIVPTPAGPRARVFATATDAQVAPTSPLAGPDRVPRYRPHWGDCSRAADYRAPQSKSRKRKGQTP